MPAPGIATLQRVSLCVKTHRARRHGDKIKGELGSGVQEVPDERDVDSFNVEDGIQLWRNLLELSSEDEVGDPLGLPDYMVDKVRETVADVGAASVHTKLAALIQLQALISAQATEVLNEKLQQVTRGRDGGSGGHDGAEGEASSLKQQSMMVATAEDGVSTYGFWIQKASDAWSEMGAAKASICSRMLRSHLRTRYGESEGRNMRGERARSLEALVVAYVQDPCEIKAEPEERDKAWVTVTHWWRKLLPAIRQEKLIEAHRMAASVNGEGESQSSVEVLQHKPAVNTAATREKRKVMRIGKM